MHVDFGIAVISVTQLSENKGVKSDCKKINLEKIQDKWLLFQWFVTSIVALSNICPLLNPLSAKGD